jgi:FAD synthetase
MATRTAAIVLIGDEILSGKVDDENARFLIGELRRLGVALRRIVVVPDVVSEIADAVRDAAARHDFVFTSGGVGPTHDDLTMQAIAQSFGRSIVRHPAVEKLIRDHFGAALDERNLRMADLPDGAELVLPTSTLWPVPAVENVYILPGIPELFRRKFLAISQRFADAPFFVAAVYSGADEGKIADALDAVVAEHASVQVGSYPKLEPTDYRVKVTLESKDRAAVDAAVDALCARLGTLVIRVERAT